MEGLDTERVRRVGGEEVTSLMKEISSEQMTLTESSITNTRRNLGFKWEVGGRLGYRKKNNKGIKEERPIKEGKKKQYIHGVKAIYTEIYIETRQKPLKSIKLSSTQDVLDK